MAGPAVRKKSENKKMFRGFLKFLTLMFEFGPQTYFGAKYLVHFGWCWVIEKFSEVCFGSVLFSFL